MDRNIIQNQTSKTNVGNLEALKGQPYSSFYETNPKNGKMIIMYRWEFKGCGKTFMRTWNLLDHIRMHNGVRPYKCKHWDKSFTQKGNMRKHLIQHYQPDLSSRKRFKWEYCRSSFTERYNYRVSQILLKCNSKVCNLLSFIDSYPEEASYACSQHRQGLIECTFRHILRI